MKLAVKITKYLLLTILIVGMILAFLFFRVWQTNARPTASDIAWDQNEVLLGHSRTLSLVVRAPWHREITSARPVSHPDFLLPVTGRASFVRGRLDLTGHRLWYLNVPMVATDTSAVEGSSITLPIKSTGSIGPNSVSVPLPPLTISSPEGLPTNPINPSNFLTEKPPTPEEAPQAQIPTRDHKFWPWLLGIAALIGAVVYFFRKDPLVDKTPPWERALDQLNQLSPEKMAPEQFFSQLTDILKRYTAERYEVPARAKTTSEFVRELEKLADIPNEHLQKLPPLAKLADAVKFADKIPNSAEGPHSRELVRAFVVDTTPQPTSENDNA